MYVTISDKVVTELRICFKEYLLRVSEQSGSTFVVKKANRRQPSSTNSKMQKSQNESKSHRPTYQTNKNSTFCTRIVCSECIRKQKKLIYFKISCQSSKQDFKKMQKNNRAFF